MNPASPDPAEMLQRVRQQLILAQVRIMELEDVRDTTGARLAESEKLLGAAQTLADQKLAEAAHAEKTRADLQSQFVELQRIVEGTQGQLRSTQQELEAELRESLALQQRLEKVTTELRSMQSTRSWRWTAWLRALGGRKP